MTPLWRLRSWWAGSQTTVLRIAVAVLAAGALLNLAHKFHRAVWSPIGSGDLRYRYEEVRHWFAGRPLAAHVEQVYYPPASYPMLWPFLGWPSLPTARLLWALTVLAMLLWLSALVMRASGAETPMERAFMAVVPLSLHAAGFTLGIGQLSAHVLALLLAGLLLLTRPRLTWHDDVWMVLLFLAALVKPTVAAPFFWIVLFVRGSLRPAWLIGVGYIALTLIALSCQPWTWGTLVGWMARGAQSGTMWGYAHVPALLEALGWETWALPTSGLLLAGLGWWVYRHRSGDLWLLLGVTALVARVWTYHLSYDDLLILLPLVALFRLAKHAPPGASSRGVVAGVLLAVTVVIMLAPHRLHRMAELGQLPPPLNWLFTWGYALVWMLILLFLVDVARRARRLPSGRGDQETMQEHTPDGGLTRCG